tara:strand:- start:336 stop:560 length:225 start_codon:yes stop_codon:yes gene_type:complete
MKKFTKQQISDQSFIMGTALLECAKALDLDYNDIYVYQQKYKSGNTVEGVWYLVGPEKNEKGTPTNILFKKDFR